MSSLIFHERVSLHQLCDSFNYIFVWSWPKCIHLGHKTADNFVSDGRNLLSLLFFQSCGLYTAFIEDLPISGSGISCFPFVETDDTEVIADPESSDAGLRGLLGDRN